MDNFLSLGLPESLVAALDDMQFKTPTPIQAQAVPVALKGTDVLGSAQTGTGKTGAYGIPGIAHLLNNPESMVLVLVPTRELAGQVLTALRQMLGGRKSPIRSALLIGGAPMFAQLRDLSEGRRYGSAPRLIVGTPGRINDHLMRGSLKLENVGFFVLDEMDRMLDLGFAEQIEKIASYLPKKHQTLMFSATMSPAIVRMASGYLHEPVRISVGSTRVPVENIKQELIKTTEGQKYGILSDKLDEHTTQSFLIFVKTKMGCDRLAEKLRTEGHLVEAIHGDLRQRNREKVIRDFRNREYRILVATDVAARGLDVPHIEYVINYDLPQCPEDYIHRIGRTGRAGAEGTAINLVTSADSGKWKDICRLLNPDAKQDDDTRRKPASSSRSSFGGGRGSFGRSGGGGGGGDRSYSSARPSYGAPRGDAPRRGPSRGGDDRPAYGASRGGDAPRRAPSRGGDDRPSFGAPRGDAPRRPYAPRDGAPRGDAPRGRAPSFAARGDAPRGRPSTSRGGDERSSRPAGGAGRGGKPSNVWHNNQQ